MRGSPAISAPLPRYPSTPEIEELDASALEDEHEQDDECGRTLERRVDAHPSVAPMALDAHPSVAPMAFDRPARPYLASRLSLTAKQRIRGARTIVLAAIGACALLFAGAAIVGARTSASSAPRHGETSVHRNVASTAPSEPTPTPVAVVATAVTPLDLPLATTAPPIHTPAPKAQPHKKRTPLITGTIRTFHYSVKRTVLVDGRSSGFAGTPITVSCGRHRVQVGTDPASDVVVPCNGAITIGTPG